MIIKGQARGRARELARHLLRTDQNESVRLFEARGVTARDIETALIELETRALMTQSRRPLYHASISPEAHLPLTEAQVRVAADVLERKLGLHRQPRVIVLHRKEGRDHVHVVWSRIDVARGRAIADGWNYPKHEAAARELERLFEHPAVKNSSTSPRPRGPERALAQGERGMADRRTVAAELRRLLEGATDSATFRAALGKAGYTLVRGDKRVFVVLDREGKAHSLARRLGIRTAELASFFGPSTLEGLPGVSEARARQQHRVRRAGLGVNYRRAARVTMHAQSPRVSAGRGAAAGSPRRIPSAQLAWINAAWHTQQSLRPMCLPKRLRPNRYQAARAIILAEFAARIAAALHHAEGDLLNAMLENLESERAAALRALGSRLRGAAAASGRAGSRPRKRRRTFRRRVRIIRGRHPEGRA